MNGAWEIQERTQVLTVVLTREFTTTTWALGFKNLIVPGAVITLSGMPFDHARNVGCRQALDLGFNYCFFLDDDVLVPPDTILRLMAHKQPIVSGLYYRRNPPIQPVMLRNLPDGNRQWILDYKVPDLMPVDFVGAGCLLIHKDALLSLPPLSPRCHWFDWRVDRTDLHPNDRLSEDFTFCQHARKHGIPIYMDTSIQCRHVGFGESRTDGVYRPLENAV